MEPIEFDIHRRASDYREACTALSPHAYSLAIAGVLCLVLLAIEVVDATDSIWIGLIIAITGIVAVSFLAYPYKVFVAFPAKAVRVSQEPYRARLDEQGLFLSTELSTWTCAWSGFRSAKETKSTICLLVRRGKTFYVIPKCDVPANRLGDLRSLLQRKIVSTSPTSE